MLRRLPLPLAALAIVALVASGGAGARHGGRVHLLALGDSYTIGESVSPAGRWPVQLAARLRALGLDVADPEIVARTGWTTDELAAAIEAAGPQGTYDLVTLMIGVNDQYRGRTVASFRDGLRALLATAVHFANGRPARVIAISIPDWGVTPFAADRDRAAVAADIDRFNAAALEEARRAGVMWVDVTDLSRAAATEPGLLADDGLHPSPAMYARWAERLAPVAAAALRSDRDRGATPGSAPKR